MIEFFKNLFRKKERDYTNVIPFKSKIEHIEEDDLEIFLDRDKGIIRIETNRELSQDELIDICEKIYKENLWVSKTQTGMICQTEDYTMNYFTAAKTEN